MKTIKEAVYDAFMIQGVGYKEMSLDDIALEIVDKDSDYKDYNPDELRKKISSYLANETTKKVKGKRVENKDSIYQRVKNGKGGYKKGFYTLRKQKPPKKKYVIVPVNTPINIESIYMGTAGEMAVCSELLFREYNISRMTVDDGIDVVAMKYNKTYYIQVKSVQVKSERFGVQISISSYDRYSSNDCYYIIVARGKNTVFIIATADDIRRLVDKQVVKNGEKSISIRFFQNTDIGKLFIGDEDISHMINSFDRIK